MEFYQLRYFLAVAAHRNITRAAAEAGITQTAMSEQMRKLEASAGATLLRRGRRQTTLTSAGQALAAHAETLLRQLNVARDAVAQVAGLSAGRLSVAAIPSVSAGLLPAALQAFRSLHPAVHIAVREETSAAVARSVEAGEVDVGVAQLPLARGAFEQRLLLREPFCVLVSEHHPLAERSTVSLSELAPEGLLLPRGRARQSALEACRAAGFEPRLACDSAELETIRSLVAAGLGVALLPALAARFGFPKTRAIALAGKSPSRRLVLLTPCAGGSSEAGARFVEILQEHVSARRPTDDFLRAAREEDVPGRGGSGPKGGNRPKGNSPRAGQGKAEVDSPAIREYLRKNGGRHDQ
jgi:DNA-binding transcriptional LysR family regulator